MATESRKLTHTEVFFLYAGSLINEHLSINESRAGIIASKEMHL